MRKNSPLGNMWDRMEKNETDAHGETVKTFQMSILATTIKQ